MKTIGLMLIIIGLLSVGNIYADESMPVDVYEKIYNEATLKDGVREISYEQLRELKASGEDFLLVDVLLPETYVEGHIEGAISLPVNTIDAATAAEVLSKDSRVVVYCGSFQCTASTSAAKKLSALGYTVVDYKGGLKEWKHRGNELVKD